MRNSNYRATCTLYMSYKRYLSACLYMLAAALLARNAYGLELPGPVVETDWLAAHLAQVRLLDVRADAASFTRQAVLVRKRFTGDLRIQTLGAHIPGATLVEFQTIRTSREIDERDVRYMLPETAEFEELMQSWGVNRGDVIVIAHGGMTNSDVTMATRLYWQIKYFGHTQVAILNGGMAQWLVEGRQATLENPQVTTGNWESGELNAAIYASSEAVEDALQGNDVVLLDTRSLGQYLGIHKQSYVRGRGHIPGARVFPSELLTTDRPPLLFADSGDIRQMAVALGIDPDADMITYCNSGQWASGSWFAFHELLGNTNVSVYDGSMHQWALEKRPVTKMIME